MRVFISASRMTWLVSSEDARPCNCFGEAPSRILLTSLSPDNIREIALRFDVECPVIGVTMKERLQIQHGSISLIDCDIAALQFDLTAIH